MYPPVGRKFRVKRRGKQIALPYRRRAAAERPIHQGKHLHIRPMGNNERRTDEHRLHIACRTRDIQPCLKAFRLSAEGVAAHPCIQNAEYRLLHGGTVRIFHFPAHQNESGTASVHGHAHTRAVP